MRKAAFSRPKAAAGPGAAEPAARPAAAGTGHGAHAAPEPSMPAIAKLLEQGFRAAAAKAVSDTHAAGLPVATVDPQGRPVWRHPDGTLEAMTDPARIPTRP
jgi:hypothetical protein